MSATPRPAMGDEPSTATHDDTAGRSESPPRPPLASALLVTATGVLGLGVLSRPVPTWIAAIATLAGVLVGILTGTVERDGVVWTLVGSALAPVVAIALAGALGVGVAGTPTGISLATVRVWQGVLVVALVGVGFGLAALWTNGLGGGVVLRTSKRVVLTAVPLVAVTGLLVVLHVETYAAVAATLADPVETVRRLLVAPRTATAAIVGFSVLLTVAAGLLGIALRTAPLGELASRERQSAVDATVDRVTDALETVVLTGLGLVVTVGSLAALGTLGRVLGAAPTPLARTLFAVTGSGPLRIVLVGLSVLAATVIGGIRTVQWLAGLTQGRSLGWVLPVCVGTVLAGGGALLAPALLGQTLERLPPAAQEGLRPVTAQVGAAPTVLGGVLAALGLLVVTLVLVPFLGVFGVLPRRSPAASLASLGLVAGSVVHALGGAPARTLFLGTVVGIVCWDIGEHGVGIAEVTGRSGSSLSVEVAHGIGSAAVGGVALGLALGVRRTLVADPPAVISVTISAFLAALVGVILLATLLRG